MSYNPIMGSQPRSIVLVQLPIPPLGPAGVRGNVPLAAAYLKLWAEKQHLGADFDIQILPGRDANTLGDHALVSSVLARNPWMVGFTCYVWNIERTLWIAAELKRRRPELLIVLGGPEITADNQWVLDTLHYDYAVIGEGRTDVRGTARVTTKHSAKRTVGRSRY
ncbi:MAG: cobalamin-dependent protein [Gemmataceae bacterium]